MRRRRFVVAYEQVESRQARLWRSVAGGDVDTFPGDARRQGRFWCAADRPPADETTLAIRPVYDGSKVSKDARCEVCSVGIGDLQEMMRL